MASSFILFLINIWRLLISSIKQNAEKIHSCQNVLQNVGLVLVFTLPTKVSKAQIIWWFQGLFCPGVQYHFTLPEMLEIKIIPVMWGEHKGQLTTHLWIMTDQEASLFRNGKTANSHGDSEAWSEKDVTKRGVSSAGWMINLCTCSSLSMRGKTDNLWCGIMMNDDMFLHFQVILDWFGSFNLSKSVKVLKIFPCASR